jgi:hypothetical protein
MKTGHLLALLFILSAGFASASTRSSTNYTVTADSIDTGGTQVASTNYSNSGSVGGIAGLSTVSSPAETMKSGYVGQLYLVTGLQLASTFVANGATQQLNATQTLDDSTLLVLRGTQTWSVVGGQLPAGLTLNPSTGVISGMPTGTGSYSFTVQVVDDLGHSTQTAFSGNIIGKMSFAQWEAQFPQLTDTAATDTPEHDGVPTLFKYVYNINPSQPMSANDRSALPTLQVATAGSSHYLLLTYRQYVSIDLSQITINVQTSPDLQNWTTVTSPVITQTGTDPNTGDPVIQVQAPLSSAPRQFIRLNVTMP